MPPDLLNYSVDEIGVCLKNLERTNSRGLTQSPNLTCNNVHWNVELHRRPNLPLLSKLLLSNQYVWGTWVVVVYRTFSWEPHQNGSFMTKLIFFWPFFLQFLLPSFFSQTTYFWDCDLLLKAKERSSSNLFQTKIGEVTQVVLRRATTGLAAAAWPCPESVDSLILPLARSARR